MIILTILALIVAIVAVIVAVSNAKTIEKMKQRATFGLKELKNLLTVNGNSMPKDKGAIGAVLWVLKATGVKVTAVDEAHTHVQAKRGEAEGALAEVPVVQQRVANQVAELEAQIEDTKRTGEVHVGQLQYQAETATNEANQTQALLDLVS